MAADASGADMPSAGAPAPGRLRFSRPAAARLVPAVIVLAAGAAWLAGLFDRAPADGALRAAPIAFENLNGWRTAEMAGAAAAFRRSCRRLARAADDAPMNPAEALGESRLPTLSGTAADWRAACAALPPPGAGSAALRAYFETTFQPLALSLAAPPSAGFLARLRRPRARGLLTGYYEPELDGRLEPEPGFETPLLARPDDLVMADLGAFREDLAGRRIAGRVENGRLVPYPDRAAIEAGALGDRARALVWVDRVEAFFLQIQGSGRVQLPGGEALRVGYAGQNGHPYAAIGKILVERGALELDAVSLGSLKTWLRQNAGPEAEAVMQANPSYVFFKGLQVEDPSDGPLGAEGVPLTAGASLAVDRRFYPMGAPMFVEVTGGDGAAHPDFARLMIAQDTGGAIRGALRGDVFWGAGEAAAAAAGPMRDTARFALLAPKALAARILEESP